MRFALPLAGLLLAACGPPALVTEREWELLSDLRWVPTGPDQPANARGNAVWDSPDAAELGRRFYFDPGLSSTGEVSCNTCHDAADSGADPGVAFSVGADGVAVRNTPTLYNAGRRRAYGWIAPLTVELWRQNRKPLLGPFHGATQEGLATHVCDVYADDYARVFGRPCVPTLADPDHGTPEAPELLVVNDLARALDSYIRTLESSDSDFDRFVGESYDALDPSCLTESAIRGAKLYVGRPSCLACHNGPTLSNGDMYIIGVGSGPDADVAYQTPPLRHVGLTGPFMHDGSFDSLWEVLAFYRDGGNARGGPDRAVQIAPLLLDDQDLVDLGSFLESLQGAPLPYCWVNDDEVCCDGAAERAGRPASCDAHFDPPPRSCP
ncbi:MAG: cytochrome c peroxidase [Myxococcota bacterium]